jgi:hypothetical protein
MSNLTPLSSYQNRQPGPNPAGAESNFVAFDIEIAKVIHGDFSTWRSQRPLGISCAAVLFDGCEPELWFSKTDRGGYASQMRLRDAVLLVERLVSAVDKGWKIVTWNGLGFDFNVLAEESGCWEACRDLALAHVDMMFHFFCVMGYPLSLDKAARGAGLPGKLSGMSAELAPLYWAQGKHATVLEYVAQDARTTLDLARRVTRSKSVHWTSNRGNLQYVYLPQGWLPVSEALKLPLPDNSWMSEPLFRNEFLDWTTRAG